MTVSPKPRVAPSSLLDFDRFARLVDEALRWRALGARVQRTASAVRWSRGDVIVELRTLCPVTCALTVRRGGARYGEVRFQRRDEAGHVADDVAQFLRTGRQGAG